MMVVAALAVAGVTALTIAGARAPIIGAPAVTEESVLAGRQIFARSGCVACHSIHGKGGVIGPDLTRVGSRKDREWLTKFLADPQAVKPGIVMPKPDVTDSERRELVDYLLSLK